MGIDGGNPTGMAKDKHFSITADSAARVQHLAGLGGIDRRSYGGFQI